MYADPLGIQIEMWQKAMSGVGFEPTPGEPDCDLNAAP